MSFTTANFKVTSSGRTSIPAVVRKEAGISGAVELIAYVEAPGRIVIETRDAILERIWTMFPAPEGASAAAEIRAMRYEDRAQSDARLDDRAVDDRDLDGFHEFVLGLGL